MFKNLRYDLPSAVVVFLVALPLCLGIALGSNAPLFSGIIAGIVGGIVIGALSGSNLSVSGPAAGLTAVVITALDKLPSFEVFLLAVVICGVFQVILGFIKAGVLGDYVPNCVIKGMLAAIGLILILKQFPHLVGYDADYEGSESFMQSDSENTFSSLIRGIKSLSIVALMIGGLSLIFQFAWEKFVPLKSRLRLIPAPLIVVIIGVVISEWATMQGNGLRTEQLVNIPSANSIGEFISFFSLPDFSALGQKSVWITGLTLALIASLETLLSIEAADDLDPYQRVTNKERELKAQGVGNMVSGLIGGLPLTSVIVRTSANIGAGARTKMSTIIHGLFLLLSVAFIASLLNHIPKSALAAILIFTGYKLAKPSLFITYFKKGWDQFLPFLMTVLAILLTDLLTGVIIGIVAGIFFVVRTNFRTSVFVVHDENRYLFRLRKDVSFLNKPIIKNKLEAVPENSSVIIDISRADYVDQDVQEVIEDFMKHASLKNIVVHLRKIQNKI